MVAKGVNSFTVNTRDLQGFAVVLRREMPEVNRRLRSRLRAAGGIVAAEAKSRADFSTQIPKSIRVRTAGTYVSVVGGGSSAPNAVPIENKGKGFVRHPVFGNKQVWTAVNSHAAFLEPAFEAKVDEAVDAIAEAIDETLEVIALADCEAAAGI